MDSRPAARSTPSYAFTQADHNQSRISQFDGLRFFAALIVFVSHFSNSTGVLGGRLGQGAGQIGVMLFFLLSGWLMGTLYFKHKLTVGAVSGFFCRRFARVAPLYVVVVVLSWATTEVFGLPGYFYAVTTEALSDHLLFVWGTDVLWTVPIEVQFYVMFLVAWLVYRRSVHAVVLASLLLIAASYYFRIPDQLGVHNVFRYFHFFLGGMVCAVIARDSVGLKTPPRMWDAAFCASLIITIVVFPKVREGITGSSSNVWSDALLLPLLGALLITNLRSSFAETCLGYGPLRYLGSISYGFYLFHVPVLNVLSRIEVLTNQVAAYFAFALTATILIAALSFEFFERHIINWVRRQTGGVAKPQHILSGLGHR